MINIQINCLKYLKLKRSAKNHRKKKANAKKGRHNLKKKAKEGNENLKKKHY